MRQFSKFVTRRAKELLSRLINDVEPDDYRDAMVRIGRELGAGVLKNLQSSASSLLICTNEDADFIARGLLDALEHDHQNVAVACFWNDRVRDSSAGIDIAPVLRTYIEPAGHVDTFIVVKSVISSACVVRTNIAELLALQSPRHILVVAPVMLRGAKQRLEREFPSDISRRFSYVWFAEDSSANPEGEVIPGIGGSVYERLGIGTGETKNAYVPELVKDRRQRFHSAGTVAG